MGAANSCLQRDEEPTRLEENGSQPWTLHLPEDAVPREVKSLTLERVPGSGTKWMLAPEFTSGLSARGAPPRQLARAGTAGLDEFESVPSDSDDEAPVARPAGLPASPANELSARLRALARLDRFRSHHEDTFEKWDNFQLIIDMVWPHLKAFLEKDILQGTVSKIMGEKLTGLGFSKTSIGSKGMQMNGVKAQTMQTPDHGEEVQLAMALEFPAQDFDIEVNYGPIYAGVKTFYFAGTMCITFCQLADGMPPMRGVRICFANAPVVKMDLALEKVKLPISVDFLGDVVSQAMTGALVLPKVIPVALSDQVDPIALGYPLADGVLVLTCVRGEDMPAADRGGLLGLTGEEVSSDVYLKLKVSGIEKRTKVVTSLSPEWDEDFAYIIDQPSTQDLFVEAWDEDKLSAHDRLATARLGVSHLTTSGEDTGWPLNIEPEYEKQRRRPTVTLRANWRPLVVSDQAIALAKRWANGEDNAKLHHIVTRTHHAAVLTLIVRPVEKWNDPDDTLEMTFRVVKDGVPDVNLGTTGKVGVDLLPPEKEGEEKIKTTGMGMGGMFRDLLHPKAFGGEVQVTMSSSAFRGNEQTPRGMFDWALPVAKLLDERHCEKAYALELPNGAALQLHVRLAIIGEEEAQLHRGWTRRGSALRRM